MYYNSYRPIVATDVTTACWRKTKPKNKEVD